MANRQADAVQYLLELQDNTKIYDVAALKQALDKPMLLDNPTQALQTVAQMKRKQDQKLLLAKLNRRASKAKRRTTPPLRPLASQALERALFACWQQQNASVVMSAEMMSMRNKVCLLGCRLRVVSASTFKLPSQQQRVLSGIVLRETDSIIHLSSSSGRKKKVRAIPKRGTVFGYCAAADDDGTDGIEFERI